MTSIFEHSDYRSYLKARLKSLPKNGRGELTRIAQHLRVNTTLVSQVMGGRREFSLEQAYELSRLFEHTELESDYFFTMVQAERAGSASLQSHLKRKLNGLQGEALKLSRRVSFEKRLSVAERSRFYSSWLYSAVHLCTSTKEKGVTIDEIADRLQITRQKATEVVQFLLQSGLVKETGGRFQMGVQSTFLERGSSDLLKHHANWRLRAIRKSEDVTDSELIFSGQLSLSKEDFAELRENLAELIKKIAATAKKSKAEDIAAINIDCFWI